MSAYAYQKVIPLVLAVGVAVFATGIGLGVLWGHLAGTLCR
jgi:F0F1-type ATP synthase membrane subunit c/vacuolar-type H+-ATPase subunit K